MQTLQRFASSRRANLASASVGIEALETRETPSAITVNAGQVVRPVNNQVLGVNVDWWDSSLNTAQTQQLVQAAGLTMFRIPGGSSSDEFHFNDPPRYFGQGTAASMAGFIGPSAAPAWLRSTTVRVARRRRPPFSLISTPRSA
jgi:hypothetical protein